jgi:signal transduction histidine kinase
MFNIDPLIIHDLRNPLGTVSACAEMLIDMPLTPDHAKRLGRNIHKAAGRMRELLAELAGGTQTAVENCNLSAIIASVREVAAAAADNRGVGIILDLPAGMEVTIARNRLERVFANLVTNGLEAMPQGGTIRISAREAGNYAIIEIEDSGPGIPPEICGRLFEPFVTARKKHGMGLGLALSRRTVREHGGDMWIEPATGARFVIRLPLRRVSTLACNV